MKKTRWPRVLCRLLLMHFTLSGFFREDTHVKSWQSLQVNMLPEENLHGQLKIVRTVEHYARRTSSKQSARDDFDDVTTADFDQHRNHVVRCVSSSVVRHHVALVCSTSVSGRRVSNAAICNDDTQEDACIVQVFVVLFVALESLERGTPRNLR